MFWDRFGKRKGDSRASGDAAEPTFYSLQDAPGDRWAARLEQIDRYLGATEPAKAKETQSDWLDIPAFLRKQAD